MSIRRVPLVAGEFFHVYNRGNSKQEIFLDKEDYERFVKLLYLCNSEYNINFRNDIVKKHIDAFDFERGKLIVHMGAWVLMPNHFHILIHEKTDKGITKYMLKLMTAYTMYFNKKYKRTGKLYEGTFKSTYVDTDRYLRYLYSYIHLNPVKLIDKNWKINKRRKAKALLDFAFSYPYSSLKNTRALNLKF